MNKLEKLRQMTTIVADTSDIDSIKEYQPTDATTNPSLLFKAARQPQYNELVSSAVRSAKSNSTGLNDQTRQALKQLAVNFGVEILNIIPGRVSTEVDARLSFDTEGTIRYANELIELYQATGVDPERILIKVASTWEGIRAATELERQGIHCNLTLLFGMGQAVACADAGVTLISPFVGRIMDWYKEADGVDAYAAHEDPGVKSVTGIYNYYKKHGYNTIVMGASFRNIDEILELAGCDYLTISPKLMETLQQQEGDVEVKLDPEIARQTGADKITLDEISFRWQLNDDPMATEKLAEGIRGFTADTLKLEQYMTEVCENC
jgi:transaldolase